MSEAPAQLAPVPAGQRPPEGVRDPAALQPFRAVPLRLAVAVPVPGLKLRDVQALRVGRLIATDVPAVEDVPVEVGGALMGWAELDSVEQRMAIRLTRLY